MNTQTFGNQPVSYPTAVGGRSSVGWRAYPQPQTQSPTTQSITAAGMAATRAIPTGSVATAGPIAAGGIKRLVHVSHVLYDRLAAPWGLPMMNRFTGLSRAVPSRKGVLVMAGIAASALLATGAWTGASYANQGIVLPAIENIEHGQHIAVTFDRVVRDGLAYNLREDIPGSWRADRALGGIRAVTFVPERALAPGAVLHVEFDNVRPVADLASGTPTKQTVTVVVRRAPDIQAISPALDAQNVLIDKPLQLQLAAPNKGMRQLKLVGELPIASDVPDSTDDTTFTWTLRSPLEQGKTYTAQVIDAAQPESKQQLASYRFATVPEPKVTSEFKGYVHPGDTITVAFDQDMLPGDRVGDFGLPGTGSWASPRRYTFVAGDVQPGKSYEYKILAGAKSAAGGFVAADKTFSVQTPGSVRVTSLKPSGTRVSLGTPISVTFDQPVDHASAEAAFAMNPHVNGSFSWSGVTMTYRPESLQYQTTYSVSIASGVKPVFGLPGVASSQRFTTAYEIKKLPVQFYRQAHALSCESASLRMALGYYGVRVIDDDVMALVGGSKGPRDTATNTWDDPYLTFVGNVDGRMGVTGWGVYSGPIAAAARTLGRPATAIDGGVSPQQIAAAIHAGNPVVLWGVSGWGAVEDSWNTATSGVVRAPRNEHVRVVYGVEGSAGDPVGFYIYDPLGSAAGLYWTTGQLRTNSAAGGGHAVIVQ